MKPIRLILLALIGVAICACLGISFVAKKLSDEQTLYLAEDQAIRNSIAVSINVTPTWQDIERYIYCEIVPKGRPRLDVERDLNQIGEYRFFKDSKSSLPEYGLYSFNNVRTHDVIYGVYVKYTDADLVADTMVRETQGSLESYIYKRFDCLTGKPIS